MLQEYCLVRGSCFRCYRNIVWLEGVYNCFRCYRNIVWLEGVASDVTGIYCLVRELLQMLQEYCLVRGSCFRCYRNIVWLEGVASDVTGILSG